MAKEKDKEEKKEKRPTAQKRDLQGKKRNLANKKFKSKVNTTLRSLDEMISAKNASSVKENLSSIFSLVDKGVKLGRFKPNKANRIKARLTKKASATA